MDCGENTNVVVHTDDDINPLEPVNMKYLLAIASVAALSIPGVALAQKSIPKADGHNQCPLGYVNTLGTKCVSPVYYEMMPTNGEACPSGWMNVGAGYCRKK